MDVTEFFDTRTVVGSILASLAGAVLLIRFLAHRYVTKLDEEIAELKRTNETLAHKVELAESARTQAEEGRNLARRVLEAECEKAKKAKEAAVKYYKAWQDETAKRQQAEAKVKELASKLTGANGRGDDLEEKLATAECERQKAQQKAALCQKKARELQTQINGVLKQDGRVWRKQPIDVPKFIPLPERKKPVIISVLNLKGGVGKTTITANLGGYLGATATKRVLMIDVDHQRSLSQLVLSVADRKAAAADGHTVQHFLKSPTRDGDTLVAAAESVPNLDNCWVLTNTDARPEHGVDQSLDDLEMHLLGQWLVNPGPPDVRFLMRQALHSPAVRGQFDFVLFDCPPRLTTGCINALTASDFLLIPVQTEAVSIRSVQHLLTRLKELREAEVLNHLRVLGMIANMVQPKTDDKHSHATKLLVNAAAATADERIWGQPIPVFKTRLIRGHQYLEATRELDDKRPLKLAIDYPSIHRQYQELVKEIEERIHESIGTAKVPS